MPSTGSTKSRCMESQGTVKLAKLEKYSWVNRSNFLQES